MKFADRREAGARLGLEVAAHHPDAPLVTALPRGGVPVGFEVAGALKCELDVLAVRKVGVPFHPELAMGAVASWVTRESPCPVLTIRPERSGR